MVHGEKHHGFFQHQMNTKIGINTINVHAKNLKIIQTGRVAVENTGIQKAMNARMAQMEEDYLILITRILGGH
ncbi:hypothetical protein A3196_20110 [Candidatus Thiodiazotropha endoloripes]|uniref:Uncharacterized protein n=1 Tax=Candidatus Thiodiazotropha endoloripes TaxID=1818881 RepID=A0A1E2UGY7_9GAMM|nr:hypothetical protein A3196_20110 [Candidatus Thiodiazotropha endoloripes]